MSEPIFIGVGNLKGYWDFDENKIYQDAGASSIVAGAELENGDWNSEMDKPDGSGDGEVPGAAGRPPKAGDYFKVINKSGVGDDTAGFSPDSIPAASWAVGDYIIFTVAEDGVTKKWKRLSSSDVAAGIVVGEANSLTWKGELNKYGSSKEVSTDHTNINTDRWIKFAETLSIDDSAFDTQEGVFLVSMVGAEGHTSDARKTDLTFLVRAVYVNSPSAGECEVIVEPLHAATLNGWDPTTHIEMKWGGSGDSFAELWIKSTKMYARCYVAHLGGSDNVDSGLYEDTGWIVSEPSAWAANTSAGLSDVACNGTWATKIFDDITVAGGNITMSNGSTLDSTSAGVLLLTEDIVKTSGDLQIGGNTIKSSNGTACIELQDTTGKVTIAGDLTVNGSTTTVQSTVITVDDKNIELGSVAEPTDDTADGGGITLKGASDKLIKWINSTDSWTFNQGVHVTSGKIQGLLEGELQTTKIAYTDGDDAIIVADGGDITLAGSLTVTDEIMGPTDGNLIIKSDEDMIFEIDEDDSHANRNFIWKDGTGNTRMFLSEEGKLTVGSGNFSAGTVFMTDASGYVKVQTGSELRTPKIAHTDGDDAITIADGGDISLAGNVTVGGNVIKASDGGSTITMDTSDNVTIAGDLTVDGGKVTLTNGSTIDSETNGTLILTEDLVKVTGDLQVTGNDIRNSDGEDTIKMDANQNVEVVGDLTVSGGDIKGPTDGELRLEADSNIIFKVDADGGGNNSFQFKDGAGNGVGMLTEAGLLSCTGDVMPSGDLVLGGGDIKNSAQEVCITIDGDQDVTIPGPGGADGKLYVNKIGYASGKEDALEILDDGYVRFIKGVKGSPSIQVSSAVAGAADKWIKIAETVEPVSEAPGGTNEYEQVDGVFLVTITGPEGHPNDSHQYVSDQQFIIRAKFAYGAAAAGTNLIVDALHYGSLDGHGPGNAYSWEPANDIKMTWDGSGESHAQIWIHTDVDQVHCFVSHLGGMDNADGGFAEAAGWMVSTPAAAWQNGPPGNNSCTTVACSGEWAKKRYAEVITEELSGPKDSSLQLHADTDMIFKVDADGGGSNSFQFKNGGNTEIANLNESGDLQIDGNLYVGGTAISGSGVLRITSENNMEFYIDNDESGAENYLWHNGAGAVVAALDESGNLTTKGDLTLKGHDIKNSDSETCITIDADQNTTLEGDLILKGHDIKNSDSEACITIDADQNTTFAGDLIGPENSSFKILSDRSFNIELDKDNTGAQYHFHVLNGNSQWVFRVENDGDTDVGGALSCVGDLTVKGGDINGPDDAALKLNSDHEVHVVLDIDEATDNASTSHFRVRGIDGGGSQEDLFVVDESGNAQTTGFLQVNGNVIKASDGGSTITMDTSDNVTIAGDLTVSGGDIKGPTDTDLLIRSDVGVYVHLDDDGTAGQFDIVDGTDETIFRATSDIIQSKATEGFKATADRDSVFYGLTVANLSNSSDVSDMTGSSAIRFQHTTTQGATPADEGSLIRSEKEQAWSIANASTRDSSLVFSTSLNGARGDNMIIKSDGKVGIGTTSPESRLHLQNGSAGTIATTDGALLTLESNEKPKIHFQSPGGYGGSIIFGSPTDNDEGQIDYDHGSDRFLFKTGGNTKMAILGDNVGIGVTDPDEKLEVAGRIHISSEVAAPSAPSAGNGGVLYTKSDGKIYWISDDLAETDLTQGGTDGYVDAANGVNNRIATFTDANSLNGEANLTFDGTDFGLVGNADISQNTAFGSTWNSHLHQFTGSLHLTASGADCGITATGYNDDFGIHLYGSPADGNIDNATMGMDLLVDQNGRGSLEILSTGGAVNHFRYQAGTTFVEGGGKTVNLAVSGSCKFGTDANSTHWFTGSVEVEGGGIKVLTSTNTANEYGLHLPQEDDFIGKAKAFSFDTYSSIRFKKNVATIDGALGITKQLRGVTFDWKASDRQDIGLIAEEVAPILPECVSYDQQGVVDGVNYPKVVSVLVEAIKEQSVLIDNLRDDVDELKAQ